MSTNLHLKDLLGKVIPNELHSKENCDKFGSTEMKTPEIPVSGIKQTSKLGDVTQSTTNPIPPIVSHSPELRKQQGDVMSTQVLEEVKHVSIQEIPETQELPKEEIPLEYEGDGFVKLPRSILTSTEWYEMSLRQRHVFLTILSLLLYKPRTHIYNGNRLDLKPGQLFITYRNLVDECNKSIKFKAEKVDLPFVQRSVSLFFKINWMSTRSDTGKTLITIEHPELYAHFHQLRDTRFDTKTIQDRYTNEERKKDKNEKGTINDVGSPLSNSMKKIDEPVPYQPDPKRSASIFDAPSDPEDPKISEEQFKEDFFLVQAYVTERKMPIKPQEIERWVRKHGGHTVISNLILMNQQKTMIRNPAGWMERAIREDWAKLNKNVPINRKFAEDFKKKHNWTELAILKKYCTIERTGTDIQFNFEPEHFKDMLESKFENLFRGHSGEPSY